MQNLPCAARRDGLRFQIVFWVQAGSVKAALSRPAWLSTSVAVSRYISDPKGYTYTRRAPRKQIPLRTPWTGQANTPTCTGTRYTPVLAYGARECVLRPVGRGCSAKAQPG